MDKLATASDEVFDAPIRAVLTFDEYPIDQLRWKRISLRLDINQAGLTEYPISNN